MIVFLFMKSSIKKKSPPIVDLFFFFELRFHVVYQTTKILSQQGSRILRADISNRDDFSLVLESVFISFKTITQSRN